MALVCITRKVAGLAPSIHAYCHKNINAPGKVPRGGSGRFKKGPLFDGPLFVGEGVSPLFGILRSVNSWY